MPTKSKVRTMETRASLYPVPVTLVTCCLGQQENVLTISWTGILCSSPPMVYISVRPDRFSYHILKNSMRFTINIPTRDMLPFVDHCGNTSGRVRDKFAANGFTKITLVDGYPPCINECRHHLLCDVVSILEFGTHHAFVGLVKHEYTDADCINGNEIHYECISPIAYCRKDYYALGEKLGHYGLFT